MTQREHLRNLAYLAAFIVALLVWPHFFSVYIRTFTTLMMMYIVLSLSWNIISGYTGYVSLGHVVFYGVGSYVTAILVVNNLRNIDTDARAGKRTLAVRLGERATRLQYILFVLAPYACVPVLLLFDAGAWVWLAWLTLPIALALSRSVLSGAVGRGLNPVLKLTAQLHLAFGALLALGLLL